MKQKLNLRNAILWTIALILPVIFFASFGANTYLYLSQGGYTLNVTWTHGFWGATYGYATGEGSVYVDPSERVGSICGIIAVFMFLAAAAGLILVTLLMKNELTNHLLSVSIECEDRLKTLMDNYIKNDEKLSEKSKENNQIEWVKLMNNYKNTAEEIILKELIYV